MGDRPGSLARNRQSPAASQDQLFDTHPEISVDFELVRQSAAPASTPGRS